MSGRGRRRRSGISGTGSSLGAGPTSTTSCLHGGCLGARDRPGAGQVQGAQLTRRCGWRSVPVRAARSPIIFSIDRRERAGRRGVTPHRRKKGRLVLVDILGTPIWDKFQTLKRDFRANWVCGGAAEGASGPDAFRSASQFVLRLHAHHQAPPATASYSAKRLGLRHGHPVPPLTLKRGADPHVARGPVWRVA